MRSKQKIKHRIVLQLHLASSSANFSTMIAANTFLQESSQFKLGKLTTEKPHPLTEHLSDLAKQNIGQAIECLHQVDTQALTILKRKSQQLRQLHTTIREVLEKGGNIYICGCGATGRLAISLEMLWRREFSSNTLKNRVFGFSAGGDTALIKAIEGFEDHPEWGAKQLCELGFSKNDLCIAITEGGETPWVIGAVNQSVKISKHKPFFLYCNPDNILKQVAKRSADVLTNPRITKTNLCIGPMGIAGSTRMQASTVLMAAAGYPLLGYNQPWSEVKKSLVQWASEYSQLDASFLSPFILKESKWYQKKSLLIYNAKPEVALTILTDTTERAPTFSLIPFENIMDASATPALCYLCLPDYTSSALAWNALLHRNPRTIEWKEIKGTASKKRLLGYDISANAKENRQKWGKKLLEFSWELDIKGISLKLGNTHKSIALQSTHPLSRHLILKMLLNIHSTIIMGRLARYEGNLMTWVRPSNKKLIDRAVRYTRILLKRKHIQQISYNKVVEQLFTTFPELPADKSIVETLVNFYTKQKQHK